jgi:hypothetical protein
VLDAVELEDEIQHGLGFRRSGEGLVEFPTHVRPAPYARASFKQGDCVVSAVCRYPSAASSSAT